MAMTLEGLRERVRGEIVLPGDESYDEARAVHNGVSDRRPSAVVRVANAGDVMATVLFAHENGRDRELTDEAIAVQAEYGPKAPTVSSTMHLYPINGACHAVASDATAFGHRDDSFSMVILAGWDDPSADEANIQWVRDYSAAIAPHSEKGGYVNFLDGDDQDRVQANYGANYPRLVEIKRKCDPDNVFRVNQNIVP